MNVKIYQLGRGVYRRYCSTVKGNKDSSHSLVQRKLTRNIALGFKIQLDKNVELYMYGNLYIFVRGYKITSVKNMRNNNQAWFYKDMNKYEELNKILGIDQLENNEKDIEMNNVQKWKQKMDNYYNEVNKDTLVQDLRIAGMSVNDNISIGT